MEQAQVKGGGLARVRQAVAEGGSEREVLRRLVEVLATLSSVNAAELRDLTATVFKTYLVPCAEPVAEAMAEAGRFCHEAGGAIKDKLEAERAEAGPPFVHVWVVFVRSLAATKGFGPEHVTTVKTHWEGNVVKSFPVQLPREDCWRKKHRSSWLRCGRSGASRSQTGARQSAYGWSLAPGSAGTVVGVRCPHEEERATSARG